MADPDNTSRLASARREYVAELEARVFLLEVALAEEERVARLIAHLRHFTPSAQMLKRPPGRGGTRLFIPTQRTAPPGVPATPRTKWGSR